MDRAGYGQTANGPVSADRVLFIRGWRLLLPLVGVVISLSFASLALTGPRPFFEYPHLLSTISSSPGRLSVLIDTNSTFRGILFSVFGYQHSGLINPVSL